MPLLTLKIAMSFHEGRGLSGVYLLNLLEVFLASVGEHANMLASAMIFAGGC